MPEAAAAAAPGAAIKTRRRHDESSDEGDSDDDDDDDDDEGAAAAARRRRRRDGERGAGAAAVPADDSGAGGEAGGAARPVRERAVAAEEGRVLVLRRRGGEEGVGARLVPAVAAAELQACAQILEEVVKDVCGHLLEERDDGVRAGADETWKKNHRQMQRRVERYEKAKAAAEEKRRKTPRRSDGSSAPTQPCSSRPKSDRGSDDDSDDDDDDDDDEEEEEQVAEGEGEAEASERRSRRSRRSRRPPRRRRANGRNKEAADDDDDDDDESEGEGEGESESESETETEGDTTDASGKFGTGSDDEPSSEIDLDREEEEEGQFEFEDPLRRPPPKATAYDVYVAASELTGEVIDEVAKELHAEVYGERDLASSLAKRIVLASARGAAMKAGGEPGPPEEVEVVVGYGAAAPLPTAARTPLARGTAVAAAARRGGGGEGGGGGARRRPHVDPAPMEQEQPPNVTERPVLHQTYVEAEGEYWAAVDTRPVKLEAKEKGGECGAGSRCGRYVCCGDAGGGVVVWHVASGRRPPRKLAALPCDAANAVSALVVGRLVESSPSTLRYARVWGMCARRARLRADGGAVGRFGDVGGEGGGGRARGGAARGCRRRLELRRKEEAPRSGCAQ